MIWFMATAKRTLVCFSSAWGSPRSVKTLPELRTTSVLFFAFAIMLLVILFGRLQSAADQIHVRFRCFDAFCRFLLKGMEHINGAFEADSVYRPIFSSSGSNTQRYHTGGGLRAPL